MLTKIKKFFTLPTPIDLKLSTRNALGSSYLTPFQKGPTWEDWQLEVKRLHPVKYFLIKVLWARLRYLWMRIDRMFYWIKCHTYTKYHLLDLRSVDPVEDYKYGILLPANMIIFAMWKGLRVYIEEYKHQDPRTPGDYTDEERQEPWYAEACHVYDESRAIYHYLTVTKLEQRAFEDELYAQQRVAIANNNEQAYRMLSKVALDAFFENEKIEKEMIVRLAKIAPILV